MCVCVLACPVGLQSTCLRRRRATIRNQSPITAGSLVSVLRCAIIAHRERVEVGSVPLACPLGLSPWLGGRPLGLGAAPVRGPHAVARDALHLEQAQAHQLLDRIAEVGLQLALEAQLLHERRQQVCPAQQLAGLVAQRDQAPGLERGLDCGRIPRQQPDHPLQQLRLLLHPLHLGQAGGSGMRGHCTAIPIAVAPNFSAQPI